MRDEDNSSSFNIGKDDQGTGILEKLIQIRMGSGKIYGPYKRQEIISFIKKGKVRGEEDILVEGESTWKPISSDMDFFDALQKYLVGEEEEAPVQKKRKKRSDDEKRTRTVPLTKDKSEMENPAAETIEKTARLKAPAEDVVVEVEAQVSRPRPATQAEAVSTKKGPGATTGPAAPIKTTTKPSPLLKLIVLLLLLAGAAYFILPTLKKETNLGTSDFSKYRSSKFYAQHLIREISQMPTLPSGPLPTVKISQKINLVSGWGAHQWVADMNKLALEKDGAKKVESAYWLRWAWNMFWTATALRSLDASGAKYLAARANQIVEELKKQKALTQEILALFDAAFLFDEGRWDQVQALLKDSTLPEASWLAEEARWLGTWQNGGEFKLEGSEIKSSEGEYWSLSSQIRNGFFESSSALIQAQGQMAEMDPLSYHLWFSAAQFFWIKNTSNVERAMRFFLVGFSALSLYPLTAQAVVWEQFFKYQSAHGRKALAERALQNVESIKTGEAFLSDSYKHWWDLGEEGLDIKASVDQIYQKVRASRSELVDLAALSVLGPVAPEGGAYMLEVAYRAAFDKNWERANNIFTQIIQKEPKNIAALGGKIWASANLYYFDEATDYLSRLGKLQPPNGEYERFQGALLSVAREYDEAEKILTDQYKKFPTDAWAYYFLAVMKESLDKNYDCTKNAANARLHAEGELKARADLLYYRCGIKAGTGVKEALAEIDKLESEAPNDISIQLEKIEALINSKKLADALLVGRSYVERSPRSYDLRLKLGDVYGLRGDFDRAVAFYNSAVALRPRSAEAFIRIAKVLEELKRFPEAAQNYEAAANAQASYPEVYLMAARAYVKLMQPQKAAEMYVRELTARPSGITTFLEAAEFFLVLKVPIEVPRIYAMVSEEFQQDPRVLVRLAQAYIGLQDYEKARLHAANALAASPKMPEPHHILGEAFENLGNYEAAKKHFDLYVRLFPEAPNADFIRNKIANPPFPQ